MTTETKLLPCPFCGSGVALDVHQPKGWSPLVKHPRNPMCCLSDHITPRSSWNTRADLPSSCSLSHPEIRYTGDRCPLCEALAKVRVMDARMKRINEALLASMSDEDLSRPSSAPAPKPCFCGGRAILGPTPQDGTDAEVQYVHATGCPRDVGPGDGEVKS